MLAKILTKAHAFEASFDWGRLTKFANNSLGNSQNLSVECCIIKSNCSTPRHYHPNCEEILIVIEGYIRHSSEEGYTEIGPGDSVTIPENFPHQAINIGESEAILYLAYSSADYETHDLEETLYELHKSRK